MDGSEILSIAELKEKYPETCILRLRGNFYQAFDDSAYVLAELTGYKISRKSQKSLYKCGFPANALEKVASLLKEIGVNYIVFDSKDIVSCETYEENAFPSIMKGFNDFVEQEAKSKEEKLMKEKPLLQETQYIKFYDCCGTDQTSAYLDLQEKISLELKKGSKVVALTFQKGKGNKDAIKRFLLSGIVIYEKG